MSSGLVPAMINPDMYLMIMDRLGIKVVQAVEQDENCKDWAKG